VVDASYDPVAWLGRKIRRRSKRSAAEAAASSPAQGPAAIEPGPADAVAVAPDAEQPVENASAG
jgi:hypothetical protein